MEQNAKPHIRWVYGPNDPQLNGNVGSAKNNDPFPMPMYIVHHKTHVPSLSGK
jgi:hypothetical protein